MRYTDCGPSSPVKAAGTYINNCVLDDYNVIGNIGLRILCTPYDDGSCTILKKRKELLLPRITSTDWTL